MYHDCHVVYTCVILTNFMIPKLKTQFKMSSIVVKVLWMQSLMLTPRYDIPTSDSGRASRSMWL